MKRTNVGMEEVVSVLDGDGSEHPTSLLVRTLVRRMEEEGDDGAGDKLAGLLEKGDSAEKYIAYCSLKEMELDIPVLDAALVAFEENPKNKRFLEYWRDRNQWSELLQKARGR